VEKTLKNLEELEAAARELLKGLTPSPTGATLITLSGELGAGKTAFTQALARALGVSENVTSPTFVLEKIYALPEGGNFKHLVHIDAYRLDSDNELGALGFKEVMRDSNNLVVLEWPERVAGGLPPAYLAIRIVHEPDGSRTMTYTYA
jgi:tRNA threonylcarbamoyladenosine biosynthesis protein TsaE